MNMKNFFFYLSFSLILTSLIFAQPIKDEIKKIGGNPQFNKSFEPINLPIDTTNSYVYFYGDKITTKVAKDSGGVSVKPYMRVWRDSVEQIVNGAFDSDLNGWYYGISYSWDAGKVSVVTAIFPRYIIDSTRLGYGHYKISFDLVVTSGDLRLIKSTDPSSNNVSNILGYYNTTGTHYLDFNIIDTKQYIGFFTMQQQTVGEDTLYPFVGTIDNVSVMCVIDSTAGYVHTITRPSDTTTFYYSQSVWWRQKDKDTIWLAAETDTVTVYPYVAPEFEEGAYTSDGNELYTIDGNRIYAKQEGE